MSKRSLAGSIWTTPDQYNHNIDRDESTAVPERPIPMFKVVGEILNGIDGTNPRLTSCFELAWEVKLTQKEKGPTWVPHRLHIVSKKAWTAGRKGRPIQKRKP